MGFVGKRLWSGVTSIGCDWDSPYQKLLSMPDVSLSGPIKVGVNNRIIILLAAMRLSAAPSEETRYNVAVKPRPLPPPLLLTPQEFTVTRALTMVMVSLQKWSN